MLVPMPHHWLPSVRYQAPTLAPKCSLPGANTGSQLFVTMQALTLAPKCSLPGTNTGSRVHQHVIVILWEIRFVTYQISN